jgi:proteic killer suppression protein
MIKTVADRQTADLFVNGTARWLPSDVVRRAVRKLEYVHLASSIEDAYDVEVCDYH